MLRSIISKAFELIKGSLHLIKIILVLTIIVCAFATGTFITIYFYFAQDLPDIKTIQDYHPPVISEVFSDDGTKIGEFWTECRIFLPYDAIPKIIANAFVDSEDARFFEHRGVDMRSIVRAFIANIKAGEITQGGSTITQQITRSLLLSRERTLTRKINEAILALRLERHLDKEQILTLYLNQIYLGNRAYGVAAAARNYFHKDIDKLTLGQIALLAALPTAPSTYSPINNPAEARWRQLHVLRRMAEEGHISEDEAKQAAEERFDIYTAGTDKTFNDKDAAYFTEHVRRVVKEKYGDDFLYHKGLKIYTTLNLPMQRMAVRAVRSGVEALDQRHGWRGPIEHVPSDRIAEYASALWKEALVHDEGEITKWPPEAKGESTMRINFKPGEVYKAIVTTVGDANANIRIGDVSGVINLEGLKWARQFSTDWLGAEGGTYVKDPGSILKAGDVILARRLEDGSFALAQEPLVQSALTAMDPHNGYIKAMVGGYDFSKSEYNRATQALRQPGSSFKPFVYAAALDKGYTYDTTILDAPVVYQVGRNKIWSPKNYGEKYKGPTSFKNALTFSRNVPTVKIGFDIGTHYITAYLRKMGITTPIDKYLSMMLGANGVYLTEMVQAYSTFATMGKMRPMIAITRIEDAEGNVLETSMPRGDAKTVESMQKAESVKAKSPEGEAVTEVKESDLNPAIFREGIEAIEKDNLILTDLEIKTLYGNQIPPEHIITPQTAYLMINLLKGVVEGGTGTRVKALGKPAAGKTGTTNEETDAWFIGFVPDLVAGAWVGFDELKPIGRGVTGGNTAAPIFLEFMKDATKGFEAKDFEKPEGFPHGNISNLAGGSALFGARPNQDFPGEAGGADRAGRFFEEDLEELEEPTYIPSEPEREHEQEESY